MPGSARLPEWPGRIPLLMAALILLAACSDPEAGERFELTGVDARWANGQMSVVYEQQLEFSNEARQALIHGVPLTIELELRLRDTNSQIRVANETHRYEIRYLPLSDHYQLTDLNEPSVRTFPRLRHVLAVLSSVQLSFETGVLPSGDYELLTRTRLDQESMPPPMRLPVLLSAEWRHDSSWASWPLEIRPGA